MLDKTLEFKNIIMRLDRNVYDESAAVLPDGYSYALFNPSLVDGWSKIEASVLEFDGESQAKTYFEATYVPHMDELQRRCVFILDAKGTPVATATAWYANSDLGYQAALHWVAVRPEHQGNGLGKAIVKKALGIFNRLDNGRPVWLHTQTWSHVAVRLYRSLGFSLVKTGTLKNCQNDFREAVEVLKAVMDEKYINELLSTAV